MITIKSSDEPLTFRCDGSPDFCPHDIGACKNAGRDCMFCNPFISSYSYFISVFRKETENNDT